MPTGNKGGIALSPVADLAGLWIGGACGRDEGGWGLLGGATITLIVEVLRELGLRVNRRSIGEGVGGGWWVLEASSQEVLVDGTALDLALGRNVGLLLLVVLPVLLVGEIAKACRGSWYLCWGNRATLLLFMVLKLGNKPITDLSSLGGPLVLVNVFPIDHRHIFKIRNIVVLDHKDSAANLDNVIYL